MSHEYREGNLGEPGVDQDGISEDWGDQGEKRQETKRIFLNILRRRSERALDSSESILFSFSAHDWDPKTTHNIKRSEISFVEQLAMFIAKEGRLPLRIAITSPTKVRGISREGLIRFSDVVRDVTATAQELNPKFSNLDLQEISKRLTEERTTDKEQADRLRIRAKFKEILLKKPYKYALSFGDVRSSKTGVREDRVVLWYTNTNHIRELRQEGQYPPIIAGLALGEPKRVEADLTIIQILRAIQQSGTPDTIYFEHTEYHSDIQLRHEREFRGRLVWDEVANDILEAARGLAPNYQKLSLQEIAQQFESHHDETT